MASLSLPRVLQQRRTTEEQERVTFEKSQSICINKAINSHEIPVKEKHVRSAIIGTFQEKGGSTFWLVVSKLPIQDNRIVAWKFCHVFHKLLREGHPQFIVHSQRQRGMLDDLGKLWCHLKEGYGKLIFLYTRFLMTKLDFHRRNPRFPGNLSVTEEELESIGENDINNYFQLSVEMFDYLDDILALQAAVFGFLDPSKCNSMMSAGQCRLAPLIPCIQDSSHLYDYCVKILFKLHSSLPPDTLIGHRDRFLKQFKILREFYLASSNLQYFKNLIQIPLLPENPPNFLIEAELKTYVTPITVILPDLDPEPEPEPEAAPEPETANFIDGLVFESPEIKNDEFTNFLLNTKHFTKEFLLAFHDNPNMSQFLNPPVQLFNVDRTKEPDKLIEALQQEIMRLRAVIDNLVREEETMSENLKEKIVKLENDLAWKDSELIQERQLKDDLLRHTEEASKHAGYEKRVKVLEDKFQKLRDHYSKLREEHIKLIRDKADIEKQLTAARKMTVKVNSEKEEIVQKMNQLTEERDLIEARTGEAEGATRIWKNKYATLEAEKLALDAKLENTIVQAQVLKTTLEEEISSKKQLMESLENFEKERENVLHEGTKVASEKLRVLLDACLTGCEDMLKLSVDEVDNPALSAFTATPDYFRKLIEPTLSSVTEFEKSFSEYLEACNGTGDGLVVSGIHLANRLASYVIQGKMTSNSSRDIEFGEKIAEACKEVGTEGLNLLTDVKNQKPIEKVHSDCENLKKKINEVADLMEELTRALKGDSVDILEDLVEGELVAMEKAIEEAAKRMEEMLNESRKSHSGIKLEVNEKILDSCTNLMSAVRLLIQKSRLLQAEIVAQGKGSHSAKEFYKRNHQWTEGLISAAKAVGVGAKFLLTCADKVVSGQGKFEQLIVASQEIAASTAQLVVASRVKADRKSDNLAGLSNASKGVTQATAGVVATAKSCSQLVEESDDLDIAGLTLHQAKRLEMESQVRVLELEASLQQERQKLAVLRRRHYQLAGEGEGWEKKDME